MKEKHIQFLGIAVTAIYFIFIVFLYVSEPKSITEIPTNAVSTIHNAANKGQVIIGTYQIDQAKFDAGLLAFRQDNFVVARDNFERADPEKHDAKTQFYMAYSFYRQGWGRVSNDDALFKEGLEVADRVIALDPDFRSTDDDLKIKTPAELKDEFEEGIKITAGDFNPLKVFRERK
ncbi:MAG TPA: hypothetical protein VL325_05450 [Pyrinomonadaceae bacterium]|nr:hypothetical protein [Pyrinomonadaceae bacterium]